MTTFASLAQLLIPRALHFGIVPFWIAGLLESSRPADSEKIEDSYPLSPLQHGMLFHTLRDRGSGVDIVQEISAFSEDLDVDAFEEAWKRVAQRHPTLRTSFQWEGLDEPIQQVRRRVPSLERHDWRDLSGHDQEARLEAFLRSDRRRGFDLHRAPLMRLALFRQAPSAYRFVWTFHHALLDGWCIPIVLKEVFAFYDLLRLGLEPAFDEPRPYRDYIEWLRNVDLTKAESFWRAALKGFRAPTPLVVDRLDREHAGGDPLHGEQEIRLSESLTSALRSVARKDGCTLNTILQAAWACLLGRYSGEEEVVFGVTRRCRPSGMTGADSVVGLFINTLPIRARLGSNRTVLDLLKELRAQWLASREYKRTPLVEIQRWSEIPRGSSLFESILIFENSLLDSSLRAQGGAWTNRTFRYVSQPNTPLNVIAYGERELLIRISHDPNRFDSDSVARMLGHMATLLEAMSEDGHRRLDDLPILTDVERRQIVDEWNRTDVPYPTEKKVHELFEEQAMRTPRAEAVLFGAERLTYEQLNARSNRLAAFLRKRGVGPDVLVGLYVERSVEMVVGLLGVFKAGGAYVPLDPSYPRRRLAFMLENARVGVVLTQESLVDSLPEGIAEVVRLDADWMEIAKESDENLSREGTPNDLVYVIYTSGSTGSPKGVAIEHRSTVALLAWAGEAFSAQELGGVLASTSICFDLSVFELLAPLAFGGKVILARDVLELSELPTAHEVRLVNTVPSAIAELLRMADLPASIETVNLAGEPLAPPLVAEILRRGSVRRVLDLYGPTEDTTYSTCAVRSADGPAVIGRPISNKRAYILDSRLRPVPVGVAGDLYVAGAGVARGYLNRPELTAEKFLPDPFFPDGGRMYRTGDRARFLPGGDIQYLGRLDQQVKIRGYRIELGEIETVLAQHPDVQESAVVPREERPGDVRLIAYLVPRGETAPSDSKLRDFLKRSLPAYMLPSRFVSIERLPLTLSGKVDRQALPSPESRSKEREEGFVPPRDPTEQAVAKIWGQVLGLDGLGAHDNFFERGGHSLMATQVVSRIRDSFGVELPIRALFDSSSVAEFAEVVAKAPEAARSTLSIPRVDRESHRVRAKD